MTTPMLEKFDSDLFEWDKLSDAVKWQWVQVNIDILLERSMPTQLPDSGLPVSKRLEWQAYRDDLRSIQDDFANPDDVIFPTEPEE